MELGEFVSKTIENIDTALSKSNYVLSTSNSSGQSTSSGGVIDFEILVTVSDSDSKQGGGKIKVFSMIAVGAEKETISAATQSSKIKFQIKRSHPVPPAPRQVPQSSNR